MKYIYLFSIGTKLLQIPRTLLILNSKINMETIFQTRQQNFVLNNYYFFKLIIRFWKYFIMK